MAAPKKTTKQSGKQSRSRKQEPPRPAYGRAVGGAVCLLLALFVIVSYFGVDALFLRFFGGLLKGLTGYGYYAFGPALLLAGYWLLNRKESPVTLRTVCALLLPVVLGTTLHLFLCEPMRFSSALPKELWTSGRLMESGGALSGCLAVGGAAVFSKVAMLILCLLLLAAMLIGALHISLADLVAGARERAAQRREEEEDELPPAPRREEKKAAPPPVRAKQPIDIPLEEEAVSLPERQKPGGFFARRSASVKTPDEVLLPRNQASVPAPEMPAAPAVPEAPVIPAEPPVPVAEEPANQEKKPVLKRQSRKEPEISRQEVAQAAEEVSRQIEGVQAAVENTYQYPPITLLEENLQQNYTEVGAELRNNSRRLAETLHSFGVDATAGEVVHGPSVTRYEFVLDQGVKLSKITNLSDDIALALGASGVRIAPIPNKISVVGIEVPNRAVTAVRIRDVVESREFTDHKSHAAFAIGKDIGGSNIVGDVAKLPHVLIAGTTGSGKSVCTNSLIVSMLYKSTPDEVRFIMVDPKMVELAPYNGIPHLLIPVVTDPKKAAGALQWAVYEMMKRYKLFSENGVKDLKGYNRLAEQSEDEALKKLPTVVVVIDELADLMLVAAKEVEESICRVAQMGRAAGMHLVIATQRPSADVITGLMKANIPSRIAFAVASSLESRIILDTQGAEKLVGKGDMLYFPLGAGKPLRVQGCFISPEEIERVVSFVKESGETDYSDEVMQKIEETMQEKEKGSKGTAAPEPETDDGDELLPAAIEVVLETGQASVSMLQRRLKLGYSRAARLVDQMELRGIVGPFEGSKPRQLLITRSQWQEMQMRGETSAASEAEEPAEPEDEE